MSDQPVPVVDDFFAELDREIAAVTAKSRLKADAKTLKSKAHNMRLSPAQRQAAADEYKAIQAIVEANEWKTVRCGAFFTQQECDGCGSIHHNFLQFMQEECKVRDHRTRRWVRIALPDESLPRETIVQPLKTHICSDCCEDHGFNVLMPTIKLMPLEGSLTVSANYTQGDINGSSQED